MLIADDRINKYHFFVALLLMVCFMKFNLFTQPIVDWDERVYLYLSQSMSWSLGNYTTAGSFIERALPLPVYSSPTFHHPPLIPFLIKMFSSFTNPHMAAKLVNCIFILISFYCIYNIALFLSGFVGAIITMFLWLICPIFNLESNLVHLDFPLSVLILLGSLFFLRYKANGHKKIDIIISGVSFALAMLTKYTAPVYVLIPFFFMLIKSEGEKWNKDLFFYGGIVLFGFSWWAYIFIKFGTLMPVEFVGKGTPEEIFNSPYLEAISKRKWYHLWIYFLAICPLFLVYIIGTVKYLLQVITRPMSFFSFSLSKQYIVLINAASILCVLIFSLVNSKVHSYWAFRHIMPFFPIVYILLGFFISEIFKKKNKLVNSYLIVFVFFTFVFMSFSTLKTLDIENNLMPIPIILFWVPSLQTLFY